MFEFQKIIADIAGMLHSAGISHFVIPHVGVGGGVEARQHIDLIPLMEYTLFFLAGIGVLFGFGLALTAKKFSVRIDPKIEQVKEVLAHAH
jgi:electron transport complex protein RnfB